VGSSHDGSGVPRVGPADQVNDDLPTATRELIGTRACSHTVVEVVRRQVFGMQRT